MSEHRLYVSGTHCAACKVLIEETLGEQHGVTSVKVDLAGECVDIACDTQETAAALADRWTPLLKPHGYALSAEKAAAKKELKTLLYAVPLGLVILALFFLLQRSGLVNVGFSGGLTPWTALLIGVVASVSTCLAVVGGLVLSLSAEVAKGTATLRPFGFFHVGRIVGFALLGGLLGLLGDTIAINSTVTAILGVVAAVVMVLLGINLLNVFRATRALQLTMPRWLSRITKIERGYFAPLIVGAGTFFLPCGFTQSMQLAALSSGSFWSGGLTMLMFALGTLPVLAALSFGSFKFARSKYAPLFFRTAGVVVIGLGLFAVLSGLAGLGIIKPIFTF